MPDDGFEYIKKILKNANAADGKLDRVFYRDVALAYEDVLIERAKKLGCTEEVEHLELVRKTTAKMEHAKTTIPWYAPEMLVDKELRKEVAENDSSGKLLAWKDTGCSGLDFTPPDLSSHKPKGREK